MKNSNRIVFIDYVRVIACFLVMLVHASENFYCISADTTMLANESNRFWVAFYDGALGRMSVPLFMVVSAFLLVPVKPNVSMSDFYKHRFKRIIPPLVFFMLIYCFLPLAWGQMTWEQSWHAGVPGIVMQTPSYEWSWEFCTPNVLLATFGAFLMFTCIKRQEAHPWITGISKLTFGMYLMHILFLSNIAPLFMPEGPAQPVLPVAVTIPCMAVLCFVCCVVTTKLISLIPGSKWIIG